MIPIGDSVRARTFPYVNVAIIVINVLVFLYELTLSTGNNAVSSAASELDRFFFHWATVPACLSNEFGFDQDISRQAQRICDSQPNVLLTPLVSMFLHGGWLHLIGNMIFLWVFGDNVEDAMGHVRYAIFYILAGFAATAAHVAINADDVTPAIGASGAISGVLAAYLVLYPRANITALLPLFIFIWIPFSVPAVFLIGFWFVLQLFYGIASLASTDAVNAGGGVAWFAHIGGFVAGLLMVRVFTLGRPRRSYEPGRRRRSFVW